MDHDHHTPSIDSDSASTNSDALSMEWDGYTTYMSENEVQLELANLAASQQNEKDGDDSDLNHTLIECPTSCRDRPLATPKLSSVVVIPEESTLKKIGTHAQATAPSKVRTKPRGNDNSIGSAGNKVQLEPVDLAVSQQRVKDGDDLDLDNTVIKCPIAFRDKPPAIPKIPSVVVKPENLNFKKIGTHSRGAAPSKMLTKPIGKRNRIGSAEKNAGNKEGSLLALLSKFTVTNKESLKSTEAQMGNAAVTPQSNKRTRSVGSTPEDTKRTRPTHSLMERRTLNLKVCVAHRPPAGNDLRNVRQFLQSEIEAAIENRDTFIPTFTNPCKMGKDGVYVYCANTACADWVMNVVKSIVESISGTLVVLPHETPLKYDPEQIMIRVVACIPTKQPREKILDNLAQLNRDLNTEKWCVKRVRPKGSSSSKVYMRIDQKSFDKISSRDSKINWILGPIKIEKEAHKSSQKKPASSASSSSLSPGIPVTISRHSTPLFRGPQPNGQ